MPLLHSPDDGAALDLPAGRLLASQVIAWSKGAHGQSWLKALQVSGWTSGGCGLLALACEAALLARPFGLWGDRADGENGACRDGAPRDGKSLQHVIIEVGGVYFDGEQILGTSLDQAAMNYGLFEDLLITDWEEVDASDISAAHICCSKTSVARLARALDEAIPAPTISSHDNRP